MRLVKGELCLHNSQLPTSSFKSTLNTAGIRTVVETYSSGSSWYRVYSDKWCEQGGTTESTSITYLKEFADTNYNLQLTPHYNSNTYPYWSDFGHTLTTTGFTRRLTYSSDWRAYGYIN